MTDYRSLTKFETDMLASNGCTADSWETVKVVENFDAKRVVNVKLSGNIQLGSFAGHLVVDGLERPCGIYNARLHNCTIGDDVLIDTVRSAIINYKIDDSVLIEDVFLLRADENATFGNGVRVSVLNEAGGREVVLTNELNSQLAYFQAIYKHDEKFQNNLEEAILAEIDKRKSTHGVINSGAIIRHCGQIKNVNIGLNAELVGAKELSNGSVLSCSADPTFIGAGVSAHDFIIAEGAHIDSDTLLEKVYVGQAVKLGNGFSAENALFFANCEGFNGEVNSIFAGPYSVTHHKSTLLIGSLFSFYNAGSGSNQSNHMYKLGPVHQGIFERGSKTGSFSYVMLESHIGAFSTIIGKHLTNINTPNLPFSYFTESGGASHLTPALNLFSVGTARDENKWPERDRRKADFKRDLIIFDIFSPYTIEKICQGRDMLSKAYEETPRERRSIIYHGVHIPRLMLRKGAKYYGYAIDRYLIGKVMKKVETALESSSAWNEITKSLTAADSGGDVREWVDISGLLARISRIEELLQKVADASIRDLASLSKELESIYKNYVNDEWDYVCFVFEKQYNAKPADLTRDEFAGLLATWSKAAVSLAALTLDDAQKEFADFSQIGFGLDLDEHAKERDFEAVRGSAETNQIVQNLAKNKEALAARANDLQQALDNLE
jgi:hypothetical protein